MHPLIFAFLTSTTILFASHFEVLKPRPLQMVITDQSLQPFSDLKKYDQDATENYFGNKQKIEGSLLCARFVLNELGELQYCKYVPVYTVLHQTTLITPLYELNLVPGSDGTDPQELIEKLCTRYTREKQAATADGEKKS